MADDLNRPFIGYRSAGRRPESQQNRRAAADAPLSALRGAVSGVLGAPGDIESLIRMLPGLSEQTVLPTSEDVEKRLPMRELNQTPTGRAFTTAGQLGGGFYTGPGSPLRAVAALPSAVSRAGRDFLMAGSPVNVVKPKGGNWLAGSVERAIEPMRARFDMGAGLRVDPATINRENLDARQLEMLAPSDAMNRWLETKLGKYIRNEMATPEDPLRALAERGVLHVDPEQLNFRPELHGRFMSEGQTAVAQSPAAKSWEGASDLTVGQMPAGQLLQQGYAEQMPWLAKVPPETPVYMPSQSGMADDLGFGHLVDELRNAVNPESGLPRELMLKYSDLEKVTVPQAVERVAKINDWRAAQKAEADMARAMNPATQVVKEYPEQGFKWVELRQPKDEIVTRGEYADPMFDIPPAAQEAIQNQAEREVRRLGLEDESDEYMFSMQDRIQELSQEYAAKNKPLVSKALEDALKYEGETMGHCVGGYCPDVLDGRSRIYSLRDKKGQPHVTIEVAPRRPTVEQATKIAIDEGLPPKGMETLERVAQIMSDPAFSTQDIVQIKGKGNKAPKEDYLPAVQDFVRSGNWGRVGDLKNAGLIDARAAGNPLPGRPAFMTQDEFKAFQNELSGETPPAEGFSRGGQVRGYAEGGQVSGANFPTDDFDPARIDAIVDELHAMNAA